MHISKPIIPKPIIGKRTTIGQAYDEFLRNTKLPINEWCKKQDRIRKNKKF